METFVQYLDRFEKEMPTCDKTDATLAFIGYAERDIQYREAIKELLECMESYPCSMSCYLTQEEQKAAQNMKKHMIKLVKEYLED